MIPHSVGAVTPPPKPAPLRWARPDTTGWTVVNIDGLGPGDVVDLGVGGGNFVIHQTVPATTLVRFKSAGPANVAWIGGEIRIDTEQFDTSYASGTGGYVHFMEGCHFDGDFRLIYLEGVLIHGNALIEGIDVWNGFAAMPVIQNCRIVINPPTLYPVAEQPDGVYHSDCFQTWSGLAGLRIANTTMITPAQGGMFGDGSYPDQPVAMQWGYTELHRVNYGMGNHTPTSGVALRMLNLVQNDRLVGPIIFDKVYADPRPRKWGFGTDPTRLGNGSFWEGSDAIDSQTGRHRWTFGQTYPSGGVWNLKSDGSWSDTEGSVISGRPPDGDYCGPYVPGLKYRPPAQVISEPFCIGGGSEENHLANRPVARTATDYLNGSTFVSRQWTVLSGPTGVGTLTTSPSFQTSIFNTIGTYMLQYDLVTSSGTASSKMRLDVIAGRANWMLNGTDFSIGLDEWVKSDTNPNNYTFDTTGNDARIIASAAGSISVRDRYSNSTKATRVFPGEQFMVTVDVRQIVGDGASARIQASWLNGSQIPVAFEDPEVYFSLSTYRTTVTYTFTVPAGAAYVMWYLAFTNVDAGDEFRFRDAYLGDLKKLNLLGGDTHFDAGVPTGLSAWNPTNNSSGFTIDYYNGVDTADTEGFVGAMRWTVTTAGSTGANSGYSNGDTKASVTPGQTIVASMRMKQTAGSFKGARIRVTYYDSSNATVLADDPSSNVTLSASWQTISTNSTVPAGAVTAVIGPYVQGAAVGNVILLDDATLKLP